MQCYTLRELKCKIFVNFKKCYQLNLMIMKIYLVDQEFNSVLNRF